jgi:mRNA interferase RelE/StbE
MTEKQEYRIFIKRSAEKEISQLPNEIHDRIVLKLLDLKSNPVPKNVKKLKGRDGYRIRIGDYRALYLIFKQELKIEIISIAHRKDVYR